MRDRIGNTEAEGMDFEQQRHNMVEAQPTEQGNRRSGDSGHSKNASGFIRAGPAGDRYSDAPLKAGKGVLMPPMVIARLLDALTIEPDNVALVIGTGSGYGQLCWVTRRRRGGCRQQSDPGRSSNGPFGRR